MAVTAPTGAVTDAQQALRDDATLSAALDDLVGRGPLPGQCGVVIAHGTRIVAADVFAGADIFARYWEALVGSYLLDAPRHPVGRPSATAALSFVRRVARASLVGVPGVGLGVEHHVETSRILAQILTWEDRLVHASAFAASA